MLCHMEIWQHIRKFVDTPGTWALVGFVIGFILGVNTLSASLLAAGLGLFLVYLWRHGPAGPHTEGWLFASAPFFIVAWIVGFTAHSFVF